MAGDGSTSDSARRRDTAIAVAAVLALLALLVQTPEADGGIAHGPGPWGAHNVVEKPGRDPDRGPECPPLPAPSALRNAPGTGLTVALVFDDGPGPDTGRVMDVLRRAGIPANFFLMGEDAAARPQTVTDLSRSGHLVGIHGWSLAAAPFHQPWEDTSLARQLDRAKAAISPQVSERLDCYFRPPDVAPDGIEPTTHQHGLVAVYPSVDSDDWKLQEKATSAPPALVERIYQNAVQHGAKGRWQQHPVVLLHDAGGYRGGTLAALPRIIDFYRGAGYRFLRLDNAP